MRPDPIFIVGMPRAGSTLIEQILASHSQVDGTLELPNIPRLVRQFRDRISDDGEPRYPRILKELSAEDCRIIGEKYLADTDVYRHGAPFFIDKMPANFKDIGLIHLILPNAKIIDARRQAMDCCFSNFRQLFVNGQEFSYDLTELGSYYKTYVRGMALWESVFPKKILRVQHEELVGDFPDSVRRILNFCELEFEPACLEFNKTNRNIRTISSEQVRKPINRDGFDRWRHYEQWLKPLQDSLNAV
jgi:hypothetical protein